MRYNLELTLYEVPDLDKLDNLEIIKYLYKENSIVNMLFDQDMVLVRMVKYIDGEIDRIALYFDVRDNSWDSEMQFSKEFLVDHFN